MFSQVFVCPQGDWGIGFPACITGHMTRGSASRGSTSRASASRGGSASKGGSASRGGWEVGQTPPQVCLQGGGQTPSDTWDTMGYG